MKPFVKPYSETQARMRAEANYHWLNHLALPPRTPKLLAVSPRALTFEHVHGRHAGPGDLINIAAHLGNLHGSAYRTDLHRAHLARSHSTRVLINRVDPENTTSPQRLIIPGFLEGRLEILNRRLQDDPGPTTNLNPAQVNELMHAALNGPVAFYKDSNPRNFLIARSPTPSDDERGSAAQDRPVTIDFDDLTLAPFGYDLAKLVVSLTMTRGRLPARLLQRALHAYNDAINRQHPELAPVTYSNLLTWAEIHHVLTSPYLGRGGYRHLWTEHRPHSGTTREGTRP